MDKLIRFPQERCSPAVDDYRAEPCLIFILPVVRTERYVVEDPFALLGGIESDRCRAAFAELEAAVDAQDRAGDLST